MTESLETDLRMHEGAAIIRVVGEIDVATAPALRDRLSEVSDDANQVIIDLSEVSFLDSTGLGVLIGCHKRMSEQDPPCVVSLVAQLPQILKVLEVTNLDSVFTVYNTAEEALANS